MHPVKYSAIRVLARRHNLPFLLKVLPAGLGPDQVSKPIMDLWARSGCPPSRMYARINTLILRLPLNHLHALWAITDVPQCNLVPILVITGVSTSNVAAAEVRKRRTLKVQCAWQETTRHELCHPELFLGSPGEVDPWRISGQKAENIAHLLGCRTTLIAEVPERNIVWPADKDDAVSEYNLVPE